MTYCVGIRLDAGLVFLSDSRTNAGLDQTGWRITAAAPISTVVLQYFAALGL